MPSTTDLLWHNHRFMHHAGTSHSFLVILVKQCYEFILTANVETVACSNMLDSVCLAFAIVYLIFPFSEIHNTFILSTYIDCLTLDWETPHWGVPNDQQSDTCTHTDVYTELCLCFFITVLKHPLTCVNEYSLVRALYMASIEASLCNRWALFLPPYNRSSSSRSHSVVWPAVVRPTSCYVFVWSVPECGHGYRRNQYCSVLVFSPHLCTPT